MEAIELLVSWIVTTGLSFAIVLWDERRLSEERLERAWPPASRDAALVLLGPIALLFHFPRTRGFRPAALLGVVACVLVAVLSSAIMWVFDVATGLPTD